MTILVTFVTRHGSTGEVAGAIAQRFRLLGWETELTPLGDKPSPAGRQLVVVGAPIYSGRWSSRARRYLKRNRTAFESVPVAIFGMGPRETTDDAFARSRGQLDRTLGKIGWLAPVRTEVFGGVDPPNKSPRRDAVDWDAIAAWCDALSRMVGDEAHGDEGDGDQGDHRRE